MIDDFVRRFESGGVTLSDFNHRNHLRLAFGYLKFNTPEVASDLMANALVLFLQLNNIPPKKFHATLTRAWVFVLAEKMSASSRPQNFDCLLSANPGLLTDDILGQHFSTARLNSELARHSVVQPDLHPIRGY